MAKSLLKRLKKENSPLIDGNVATFIWKGAQAPRLVGDFTGWEDGEGVKMVKTEPGVWIYQLSLPEDAYIEYGFLEGDEHIADPFNPRQSPNGMGGSNNYFHMPRYTSSPYDKHKANIPHGLVNSYPLASEILVSGIPRTVHLYQPSVSEPAPLIVVWDGQDYLHRMHLNRILDNLIAEKRIRPLAAAFINNGGRKLRTLEYSCSDVSLGFLMTEVMPLAREHLNLVDIESHPGEYAVLGASMGGLMALYTGVRMPHIFGKVLSQSGAFSWGDFDMVVFDLLAKSELLPLKIWMDAGKYDIPGLLESNLRMRNLLDSLGYSISFREYHAGHNYPAWRDEIHHGLQALYGVDNSAG